jgi:hypothetical protein
MENRIQRSKRVTNCKYKTKKQNKIEIITLQKFERVYLSFMPLDLTEMVVSWESRNIFK